MNKLDASVVSLAIVAALIVLLAPAGCTMHRHYRIEQAIRAGADPLEAKCAIEADVDRDPICIAVAIRR